MRLEYLFEIQAGLDAHIEQEHPRQEGEDRLSKKILALQVELGELAQNWRGFKFWSEDQEPRTVESIPTDWDDDGTPTEWNVNPHKNPLLEEYVDCLHFILSIGLELNVPNEWALDNISYQESYSITEQFIRFNKYLKTDLDVHDWFEILEHFLGLGDMLGFSWNQIEQAYLEKNKVNHERQNNGY
ncbi:dUTP diphosphatase [Ornithinibacillus sp. JPR2-1]|uniref:dUTP diphosphatase n=1 Tax=Ornithinibacillus sp. JPR2-1 TaxID=2094019 RepID=UPI0031CE495C